MFLTLSLGVHAAPTDGGAAGSDASTLSQGQVDALGVGAVAVLTGVLIASAGGSGGESTGTTTTTSTTR
ncbi:exopolysaccharide production protein YjbE [Winslowiella iniecta]|uniref:exopolysaccharide production protein YjbE n=1 Tax=Winslowiella iniecta TaxID=1560201 RepID=UPI001F4CA642|nr:exopolysaccharide production protein YjbE [Winslowiella iniecta]